MNYKMPPHLLVVGAGNSIDPGPARLRQEAKQRARRRLRYDRRSYYRRRHRCFSTPTLYIQVGSMEGLLYKRRTSSTWPRRGLRGLHPRGRAFLNFCGRGSRLRYDVVRELRRHTVPYRTKWRWQFGIRRLPYGTVQYGTGTVSDYEILRYTKTSFCIFVFVYKKNLFCKHISKHFCL